MVISTLCVGAEMPLNASFALSTSYCGLWWAAPGSKYVLAMQADTNVPSCSNVSVREGGLQNGIDHGTVPSRTDPRHPRHHRLNFLWGDA